MTEEKHEEEVIETKKSDEEILLPEVEVSGFVVKPWTLGKLKRINPFLEHIFIKLEKKGVKLTLDNLSEHLKDIYFAAVEPLVSILAISLDRKEEELEDLSIEQTVKLVYLVYKQNEESIKNVSSLLQMPQIQP